MRNECQYLERKKKIVLKTRSVRQLEARLAELEAQIRLKSGSSTRGLTAEDQDGDATQPVSGGVAPAEKYREATRGYHVHSEERDLGGRFNPKPDNPERESLGLRTPAVQEFPPPEDVQMDLFRIFFHQINPQVPIVHKARFYAALKLGANQQPPIYLQYAIWALAALVSPKYESQGDIFYERAHRYADAAELMDRRGTPFTIYDAQCWHLIATFEAKRAYQARTWISSGKCVRLVQTMGLQFIDKPRNDAGNILPPARDFAELEERRRTFWAAYFGDRWASLGTGWPMMIDETEIYTNLPASDMAFEEGTWQTSVPLLEALCDNGASRLLSSFSGFLLAVTLLGRTSLHIHRIHGSDNPGDLKRGEFWRRHREIDTTISATLANLPEYLKLPQALRDQNAVLFHMCLHSAAICLHQASVVTALEYRLEASHKTRSLERCITAADEITTIMKMISHFDASHINPWAIFCLYLAGHVYCNDMKFGHPPKPNALSNVDFLLLAMKVVGKNQLIIQPFTSQLESSVKAVKRLPRRLQSTDLTEETSSDTPMEELDTLDTKIVTIDDTRATPAGTNSVEVGAGASAILSSKILVPEPPLFGITIHKNQGAPAL